MAPTYDGVWKAAEALMAFRNGDSSEEAFVGAMVLVASLRGYKIGG